MREEASEIKVSIVLHTNLEIMSKTRERTMPQTGLLIWQIRVREHVAFEGCNFAFANIIIINNINERRYEREGESV
jgi:hypothetical protein